MPNLDDRSYAEIVEAAKRRIPVIYPEWTDFNETDPGITMLELFAWLKEMQQYYLNRISDDVRERMLRLLGVEPYSAQASQAVVFFDKEAPEKLPRGASVYTADGAEFVCSESYSAAPFKIGRLFVGEDGGEKTDVTSLAFDTGSRFYPFGGELGGIGRALYIEIKEISDRERFLDRARIMFEVSDELPVKRNAPIGDSKPPREIKWEYSTATGYKPCKVLCDETFALSLCGGAELRIGSDFAAGADGLCIRAVLCGGGCEDMPRLRMVYCGELRLEQKSRQAAARDFALDGGKAFFEDALAAEGITFAFVRDGEGWQYAEKAEITKNEFGAKAALPTAPHNSGKEPNVRLISCSEEFGRNKMFFSSNGLPDQSFDFDPEGELVIGDLRIMVKDRESAENGCWREYTYIESLSLAGAYDRCFSYDFDKKKIVFGDNEHGEVPPPGDENVMIISCSTTKGADGNVMAGNLKRLEFGGEEYRLVQPGDSVGGRNRDTVPEQTARLRELIGRSTRAVTAEDYRTAALGTPGLRIADAAAIPFFDPEYPRISKDKSPNTVTVAVIPYSAERFPMPDERFLEAVKRHLENYRPITKRVIAAAPIYVGIDIRAEVICGTREVEKACGKVREALEGMFSIYGEDGRTRFGCPIAESDVIAKICSVEGILSVKRINIGADNPACARDRYGRIIIPPHAVAYLAEAEITTAEI